MIGIVDYGLGNLASVRNAFLAVGAEVEILDDPRRFRGAAGLVLPGVGSASAGMERIVARAMAEPLREAAAAGTPILGLCLGMQLLFERSEEGDVPCLGLMAGTVDLLRGDVKVPHIGWNQVETRPGAMWTGMDTEPYVYFVHSYVCRPTDQAVISGITEYGEQFCSSVQQDSLWGTQFHPERSGPAGLRLLANFAARCGVPGGVDAPFTASGLSNQT